MATLRSTGTLTKAAANERTIFQNGTIELWSGGQGIADGAMTGTKLVVFTLNGGAWVAGSPTNGLTLDAPTIDAATGLPQLVKPPLELWQGLVLALGTASSAVYRANAADANGVSTTLDRMSMAVSGESGTGELKLSKTTFTVIGEPVSISTLRILYGNPVLAL